MDIFGLVTEIYFLISSWLNKKDIIHWMGSCSFFWKLWRGNNSHAFIFWNDRIVNHLGFDKEEWKETFGFIVQKEKSIYDNSYFESCCGYELYRWIQFSIGNNILLAPFEKIDIFLTLEEMKNKEVIYARDKSTPYLVSTELNTDINSILLSTDKQQVISVCDEIEDDNIVIGIGKEQIDFERGEFFQCNDLFYRGKKHQKLPNRFGSPIECAWIPTLVLSFKPEKQIESWLFCFLNILFKDENVKKRGGFPCNFFFIRIEIDGLVFHFEKNKIVKVKNMNSISTVSKIKKLY